MKKQIINTFALIGVITVIAIACSSALSDDDDVIIPNNSTEVAVETNTPVTTTTNTGTTNTSSSGTTTTNTVVQNEIGRYQIANRGSGQRNEFNYAWIIDTKTGSFIKVETYQNNIWIPLPN